MNKKYYYNKNTLNFFLIAGIICLIFGIFLLFFIKTSGSVMTTAVVLIVFYFIYNNHIILDKHEDHFVLKLAPFAAKLFIKNSEIANALIEKNKIILTVANINKPIRLPLSLFNKHEREEILKFFRHFSK